jgi:hypothetical protein
MSFPKNTKSLFDKIQKQAKIFVCFLSFIIIPLISCNDNHENYKGLNSMVFTWGNNQDSSQYFWQFANANSPELWISLGGRVHQNSDDTTGLAHALFNLWLDSSFSDYNTKRLNTLSIWNENDNAGINASSGLKIKNRAKELYFKYLKVDENSEMRSRAAIYNSYTIGEGYKQIKVIMTDCYWFQTQDSAKRVLGDQQIFFISDLIRFSKARLNIICLPIPLSDSISKKGLFELSKIDKEKLIEIFKKYPNKKIAFFTGLNDNFGLVNHFIPELNSNLIEYKVPQLVKNNDRNFLFVKMKWKVKNASAILQVRGLNNQIINEEILDIE